MSSMSNTMKQLLDVVRHRAIMNILMEEVEHDVLKLEEIYSTIVVHGELRIDFNKSLEWENNISGRRYDEPDMLNLQGRS
ncbi:hypothetical protein PVK06_017391 [Gossypium arboreum]|uniref:Uncharacterized protein n=1 Tax=Gossypium arboreum TaxID=29729 RepID=A0ABR0Q2J2_GOSAR|nr:hypothetical protein PVK06_017391 [Gossypium arboreum]